MLSINSMLPCFPPPSSNLEHLKATAYAKVFKANKNVNKKRNTVNKIDFNEQYL